MTDEESTGIITDEIREKGRRVSCICSILLFLLLLFLIAFFASQFIGELQVST